MDENKKKFDKMDWIICIAEIIIYIVLRWVLKVNDMVCAVAFLPYLVYFFLFKKRD